MSIKRQHYVPQGFLKAFNAKKEDSNKFIWVYEKLPNRRPRCVSIKSIAYEPYYYNQESESGKNDDDSLEKKFAQTVDNELPKIIQSLDTGSQNVTNLSEEDQGKIAFFLGIQLTRVPNFRSGIKKIYDRVAQITLDMVTNNNSSIADLVEQLGVTAEAKDWVSLEAMVILAKDIALSTLKKNWQFFVFVPHKDISLISSDNPVHFTNSMRNVPNMDIGPAHHMSEIVVNLRSDLALVCTPRNQGGKFPVFHMNKQEAKKFNRGTARAARRFVFANHLSDGIEKLTKKYHQESQAIEVG